MMNMKLHPQSHAHGIIAILAIALSFSNCQFPLSQFEPATSVGRASNRSLIRSAYSGNQWLTDTVSASDLVANFAGDSSVGGGAVYGDVGAVEAFGFGFVRGMEAPSLVVNGKNSFSMAFSQLSQEYNVAAANATSEDVFLANTNSSGLWNINIGSLHNAGTNLIAGLAGYLYFFHPVIAQSYDGVGALGFLRQDPTTVPGATGTTQHEFYAWTRASTASSWIGNMGGTTQAALISGTSGSNTAVNNRNYSTCPARIIPDYASGFLAFWCGNNSARAYNVNVHIPHVGWSGVQQPGLLAGYANDDPTTVTFGASVSPSTASVGMDAGFLSDGTRYGWVVQVLQTAGAVYTLQLTMIDPVTNLFSTTSQLDILSAPPGTVLYAPKIYVHPKHSSTTGNITVFYMGAAAGSASGTMYSTTISYNYSTGSMSASTSDNASAVDSTVEFFANRASAANDYGEVVQPILKMSPNGSKALVAWPTSVSTISVLKLENNSFTHWQTLYSPTGLPPYSMDFSINNDGDAVAVVGWGSATVAGGLEMFAYRALAQEDQGSWDSGTNFIYNDSYCSTAFTKVAVALDNDKNGMAAMTCVPLDSTGVQTELARNVTIRFNRK